jgi:protein phosphatase
MDTGEWTVRVGVATDVGRVREHNEDAAVARGGVYAVADGMGGHAAGEVASAITAHTLARLGEWADRTPEQVLAQVERANAAILAHSERNPGCAGMATTVTGFALVKGPAWVVFNVGDSRVYRYASGALRQVTVDHSEVQLLVDAGYLTPAQAAVHPLRHIVTRCLGRPAPPPVDAWELPVVPGEVLLACSDGLTGEVEDAEIAQIVSADADPQEIAERLAARAVELGGSDNVTVVVVRVDADAESDADADADADAQA